MLFTRFSIGWLLDGRMEPEVVVLVKTLSVGFLLPSNDFR